MSAASTKPGLKIKAVVLFFLCGLIWSGVCFAAPLYTIEIGKFKALPAARDAYNKLPPPVADQAFITHSGINFRVCCGKSVKKEGLNPVISSLKNFNINPTVVQIDSSDCLAESAPADTLEKLGAPSNPAHQSAILAPQQISLAPQPATVSTKRKKHDEKRRYADMKEAAVRRYLAGNAMLVMPESATKIFLSNRDVNRITCANGPIKDIVYSKEKGISVKTDGDNAFVKFLISRDPVTGKLLFADTPSEFYVIGEDNAVYTLIASPKDIPAQTVRLVSATKHIKKVLSLFEGLPFEKKVLLLVKATYTDKIPDSLTVKMINKKMNLFRDIGITLQREVIADGEGLLLKEYVLSLKNSSSKTEVRLKEKFFLLPELAKNPVGISLEHMTLKKGQLSRLFIVEKEE